MIQTMFELLWEFTFQSGYCPADQKAEPQDFILFLVNRIENLKSEAKVATTGRDNLNKLYGEVRGAQERLKMAFEELYAAAKEAMDDTVPNRYTRLLQTLQDIKSKL